jgi:hypothetical protein
MNCIIYPVADGIAVIHPSGHLPLDVVARKDVPQDVAYKVIDIADLPEDRTFRAAWEADFSEPDGFGDPEGYWAEEEARLAAVAAAEAAAKSAPPTNEHMGEGE